MIRLDHVSIPVREYVRPREWYTGTLGLKVEFEIPERRTVALQDDADLTLLLFESLDAQATPSCVFAFQVDNVETKYQELSGRGVAFEKSPQKLFWGYGAELRDPDGYLIYLWDKKTMREKDDS